MNTTRFAKILMAGFTCAIMLISGCATVTPPTSKLTPMTDDMLRQHKGDVQGLYNAWIKPQTHVAHAPSLDGPVDILPTPMDSATEKATETALLKDFGRFCKASGGKLITSAPALPVCNDASGAYLGEIDFEVFFTNTDHTRLILGFDESSRQQRQQEAQAAEQARAARKKQDYDQLTQKVLATLDEATLNRLIKEFVQDDPEHRLPRAKARLAALQAKDAREEAKQNRMRLAQVRSAQTARRRAQEHLQIGDQVCYVNRDTVFDQPTGVVVMGVEQYRHIHGMSRAVGFIEGKNRANGKIKIRISGLTFSTAGKSESMDDWSNYKNGVTLRINRVIWDDLSDWDGC